MTSPSNAILLKFSVTLRDPKCKKAFLLTVSNFFFLLVTQVDPWLNLKSFQPRDSLCRLLVRDQSVYTLVAIETAQTTTKLRGWRPTVISMTYQLLT